MRRGRLAEGLVLKYRGNRHLRPEPTRTGGGEFAGKRGPPRGPERPAWGYFAKTLPHFSLATMIVTVSRQGLPPSASWHVLLVRRGGRAPEHTATRDQEQSRHNVSKLRSQKGRVRGPRAAAGNKKSLRSTLRRRLLLEALETRALLTYAPPFGAMPDDTGEFMLGDVVVNVVLMESDPGLAPHDNSPTGHNFPEENWDGSFADNSIANVKAKVEAGVEWWKETLLEMFPAAPEDLLTFHFDWEYADDPVLTGYEPIARESSDFYQDSLSPSGGDGWMGDFFEHVGFDLSNNFSANI